MAIILCMGFFIDANAQSNLNLSGITNPSDANGTYLYNGTLNGYDSWKHESLNYYIYHDDYGTDPYWNIDNNTDDNDDVLFYSSSPSTVTTPVDVPSWSPMNTATGTPSIVEQTTSAPSVTTDAASSITSSGATLNGTVNANNASTTVTFEYGLTTSYGSSVTADQSPVTGSSNTSVSKSITGLSPNTTYHFRVVGSNSEGTSNGADQSFTTDPTAPTVTTQAVSDITVTAATGNGNITDLGAPNPSAYGVCWNNTGTPTTSDHITDEGGATATGAFTSSMTGLSSNSTYYVRAYATNSAGTSYGEQVSFTTYSEVTFTYHDEEGAIHTGDGEQLYIAGDFNGWSKNSNQLANNGDSTFSVTLELSGGAKEYKYVVYDGSSKYYMEWLNDSRHSINISGNTTRDDHRNAAPVSWANLQTPSSTSTYLGDTTEYIYGSVYIEGLTDTTGKGRAIKAQVGYGTDPDPANWTQWNDMTYYTDDGSNNDEFNGELIPIAVDTFSYATRYDANWGSNNPNRSWTYGDLDANPYSEAQAGELFVSRDTITWDGSSWEKARDVYDNLLISGDFTSTDPLECYNFIIAPGKQVTTDHALTINKDLVLKADSSGQASLLDKNNITVKGQTIIQQFLPQGRWWYVSPQVSGSNAENALMVDQTTYQMFYWNENNGGSSGWTEIAGGDMLNSMQGYAYINQSSDTIIAEYTGTLNTGALGVADNVTRNTGAQKEGFNLVGNPYPSHINWGTENTPSAGLTKTNLTNTIWVRKDGNFATYNWSGDGTGQNGGSQFIAPGQAVWVRVSEGSTSGTYALTNDARTHNSQHFLKSSETNVLRIELTKDTYRDECVIGFYPDAQNNFDRYDSEKMFATDEHYPQIFSILEGHKLAIQGEKLPLEANRVIPIGVMADKSGRYTISAKNITEFMPGHSVLFVDTKTGKKYNFRESKNISLDLSVKQKSSYNERFQLEIGSGDDITDTGTLIASAIKIYMGNKQIYLSASSDCKGPAIVEIYNITGQRLVEKQFSSLQVTRSIPLTQPTGYYVVKITTANKIYTEKLFLR